MVQLRRVGALWIKRVTRELHGCRPQNLMVSEVREIGNYFGCKGALLVSNKNRISINLWRRRQITSNYDQIWEEMSAMRRADDDFELPCTGLLKIVFDALPSKKRSEAKKRSAMLDAVFQAVRARLDAIKSEPDRAVPCQQQVCRRWELTVTRSLWRSVSASTHYDMINPIQRKYS
jgi:hypothetical protein